MLRTLGLEKTKFCSSLERDEWSGTSRKLFLFPKVFNNNKNYAHQILLLLLGVLFENYDALYRTTRNYKDKERKDSTIGQNR